MVADPVQATYNTFLYYHAKTKEYISNKSESIQESPLVKGIEGNVKRVFNDTKGLIVKNISNLPPPPPPPETKIEKITSFIKANKKLLSILTVGIGGTSMYYMYNVYYKKPIQVINDRRRVPKLPNGARKDVVLVVGSPTEPLTRLIALDFEKRGFIVYLTLLDEKDTKYIESNSINDDINYLILSGSSSFEIQLNKFQRILSQPVVPFQGAEPHKLNLVSVVFAPNLYYTVGPIENISVVSWQRLLSKFELYLKLFSSGLVTLVRNSNTKIILINPTILSSINLPYHSPESIFQNSLKSLFLCLAREISSQGIQVTQIRLGNLNISKQPVSQAKISNSINSEILNWDDDIKELYGAKFSQVEKMSSPIHGIKGSNLRELYHLLFDLIYNANGSNPSVTYCGGGARLYDLIGSIAPESFIDFILRAK